MPRAIENAVLQRTPEPAAWLTGVAKEHFKYIVPLLIKDEVVCAVDVPVIEAACELYSIFKDRGEKLSDRKSALASYISIMSAFGVTYKARKTLAISKESSSQEADPTFGGLFDDDKK